MVVFILLTVATIANALHILELVDIPTIITVPEIRIQRPGFANIPNTSTVHVGLTHSFLGLTDVGFIDYKYNALQKPSSIHIEDYAALFAVSTITVRYWGR